jgi:hypothetical protein
MALGTAEQLTGHVLELLWRNRNRVSAAARYSPIALDGQKWLQDFDGNLLRPATEQEIAERRSSRSFSPAAVEDAILSLHGLDPWHPAYDAMRVSST